MPVTLPSLYGIDAEEADNPIQQIIDLKHPLEGNLVTFTSGRVSGFLFRPGQPDEVLILPNAKQVRDGYERVLIATPDPNAPSNDLSKGKWRKHPSLPAENAEIDYATVISTVRDSWNGAFSFTEEDPDHNIIGLRRPQVGAVHAAHMHWTVSESAATIVMPTGTGKTETMLSILVSISCEKLLVIVPTDALRTQLAEKFLTLGVLKLPGSAVLKPSAKTPIVCALQHIPATPDEVDRIFTRAQVIVTTSHIAGQCDSAVQERMAAHCPYLFIDEAHHAEAPTWSAFKERFRGKRILQFTATPYREDGRPLDGDIIFKYPLKLAQEQGYFAPINFEPVVEFNKKRVDRAIAEKAIEQLRQDQDKGHILMARVEDVSRAKAVYEIYSQYAEFNPVQLHTGIKSVRTREAIRQQIISGQARIVVCVDMLGEGFDLPELKIAAFHDIRKTLAVTLQLAGRFTRKRPDLGNATFIANTADVSVQDELRKLYTRDPDWNMLLPQLSERMIGEQLSLQEFLRGFTEFTKDIPLKTIRPATSTVVYRTNCENWMPHNFRDGLPALNSCERIFETINHAEHTLVIVTVRRVALSWTSVEDLFSWEWELYVVIWSPEQNLLFINSSTNSGEYKALAKAIAGDSATLIRGQQVFRTFAGVTRLRLQNVGLTEQLGRNVRYTGRMGADVAAELPDVQRRHARKSVLSGGGFEDGANTTVGASRKGRIWSHRRDRIDQLAAWCRSIGAKLLDENINPDEILQGTLEARTVTERPALMPIAVDWPEEMYTTPENLWSIVIGQNVYHISELDLELVTPSVDGPLTFRIVAEEDFAELGLELFEDAEGPNYRFVIRAGGNIRVRRGERAEADEAVEFFYDNPPMIWFHDGSALEGNDFIPLKTTHPPYDATRILDWNWAGIDIRKESQGQEKAIDSIQSRVIRTLMDGDYHMIIDDDGKGEAADVVTIKLIGDVAAPSSIDIEFYHCKYSHGTAVGRRVDDLYEVCGQAQKSIAWTSSHEKRTDLFTHLLRREARRQEAEGVSRYERGDGELLLTIREMSRLCPVALKIYIVQPGLSKGQASPEQLELLSVTETYLMETYRLPFAVIASA
jgi:superfamily II DNA or RNA helicase